jgi:hypothetical protein
MLPAALIWCWCTTFGLGCAVEECLQPGHQGDQYRHNSQRDEGGKGAQAQWEDEFCAKRSRPLLVFLSPAPAKLVGLGKEHRCRRSARSGTEA